jgi:hypothetical protein
MSPLSESFAMAISPELAINVFVRVIDLDADESVTITGLISTNTGDDAIQITSRRGGIVDAGAGD